MGSKNRIAHHILPIILHGRTNETYVEPFCGGCNTIDKVKGKRIAGDYTKHLITLWKGLQNNEKRPYKITRELYDKAKAEFDNGTNNEFTEFELAWIGFMSSFRGGGIFSGYTKHYKRCFITEHINNIEAQVPYIKDIEFYYSSYENLLIPNNSIIYCDIPYKNTSQYDVSKDFDYDKFYEWCIKQSKKHKIYISEYSMPEDFDPIWQMEIQNTLSGKSFLATEKLFVVKGSKYGNVLEKLEMF